MATGSIQTAENRAERRWAANRDAGGVLESARRSDVDLLVATYAPKGRARRSARQARTIKSIGAGLVVVATVAVGIAYLSEQGLPFGGTDNELQASIKSELAGVRRMNSELASELALVSQQRRELEMQRQRVADERGALRGDLEAIRLQQSELEMQRQGFDLQRNDLAAQLASLDAEQQRLEAQRSLVAKDGPELQRALTQLEQQRRELEREQASFGEQRATFVAEIEALTGQREQLEMQRQQLENQWIELQGLMDRMNEESAAAPATELQPAEEVSEAAPQTEPYSRMDENDWVSSGSLAAVADEKLGEMRGAISFGDDLNIAIGLTRTASVNGVQQYSSSLRFNSLDALSMNDLGAANTMLIQSGAGNSVAPAVMNSLSNGIATIIQNTLDNQNIATTSVFDVAIGNAATAISDVAAFDAITDSVAMQP
jgi:hypothetical protein